jgi:18S rRNA (adenine1779-N6/adenine1780-N6)-dimethyltransferase|uniref:rRNA adenine N(6)-methyltransferase n=1 Tax=Zea mays TaxID=4577 RepID=B4FBX7_MAIZE|nr:unknown [Zea mays]
MKRAVSALWARRAVRQAYLYTPTAATATSSSPEFGASTSEAWDGRFRLHKPRGQHLLTNPRVLDAIARHAAISPGDAVLEVGPGTGNLTARLLASQAARVTAVEIDPRMVEAVTARAAALGLAHKFKVRPPARHSLDRMSKRKSLLTENDGSPSLVFGR